jgi:hypothetical protein
MSGRHRRGPAPRRGRHRRPPSRQRLIVPALAATVVLAGSGTALGFAVGDQDGAAGGVATPVVSPFAAPAVLSNAPIIDPTPSIASTPSAVRHHAAAPRSQRVHRAHPRPTDTLVLRVTGAASYVQVLSWNDHLLVQRILRHGQHLAYRQHGLRVVLGDAGAVRMSVAGRPARRAGSPGEVLHFRVN